jgi:hypothetical protein
MARGGGDLRHVIPSCHAHSTNQATCRVALYDSEGKNPNSEKTQRTNKNVWTLIIREKTLTVKKLKEQTKMRRRVRTN